MENTLPDIESPLTYPGFYERLVLIRGMIFEGLADEYVKPHLYLKKPSPFDIPKLFESDRDLRASAVEAVLSAILWLEAGRLSYETLCNYPHETKCQIVNTLNRFDQWLSQKAETRREVNVSHSMVTAWIRLFVEFSGFLEVHFSEPGLK